MGSRATFPPNFPQMQTQIVPPNARVVPARAASPGFDPNQQYAYYVTQAPPQYAQIAQYGGQPAFIPGYQYQMIPSRFPPDQQYVIQHDPSYPKPEIQYQQRAQPVLTAQATLPPKARPIGNVTGPVPIKPDSQPIGYPMQYIPIQRPIPVKTAPTLAPTPIAQANSSTPLHFEANSENPPGIFNIVSRGDFPSIVFSSTISLDETIA